MSRSARSSTREHSASQPLPTLEALVLNRRQRARLDWLVARNGPAQLWDGRTPLPAATRTVIVMEPPTGPAVDLFLQTLAPDAAVVIPYGENPLFDFLKSKLVDFGTVGAGGAEGPHQFWWGGFGWHSFPTPREAGEAPRVVARYVRSAQALQTYRLARSLAALGLSCDVDDGSPTVDAGPAARIDLILDAWRASDRPILWVDPGALVRRIPSLPAAIGCDFAVHRWNRWEFSPAALYFGRSAAAAVLLRTWRTLAFMYPDVWEGQLLDQAWSLVSSQMPLDTVWLPAAYHAAADSAWLDDLPVIVQDIAAGIPELAPCPAMPARLRAARRAGRTGAAEAQLVMVAPPGREGVITVMLRDVDCSSAVAAAAALEAAADAFATDPGDFSQLEVTLCRWEEDVQSVRAAAAQTSVLHTTPQVRLASESFRRLRRASARPPCGVSAAGHQGDVFPSAETAIVGE